MSRQRDKGTSLAERLWRRVDRAAPDDCWEWQGYISTSGYGLMGRGTRAEGTVGTHRVAWEVTNGPIPAGLLVCHTCDNRLCCNPAHMFLGTIYDNAQDMKRKGRGRGAEGSSNGHAKLTRSQVDEIVQRYEPAIGKGFGMVRPSNAEALAAEFGITPQYVSQLARNVWRKSA